MNTPHQDDASVNGSSRTMPLLTLIPAPIATMREVAKRPRWLAAFLAIVLLTTVASTLFYSSQRGSEISAQAQARLIESGGRAVSDADVARIAERTRRLVWLQVAFTSGWTALKLFVTIVAIWGLFAALGYAVSFPATASVVSTASILWALETVITMALDYARGASGSSASLLTFFPGVSEAGIVPNTLAAMDVVTFGWLFLMTVGLSEAYQTTRGRVLAVLIPLYLVVIAVQIGVKTVVGAPIM